MSPAVTNMLDPDNIFEIALHLPIRDVYQMALSCRVFYRMTCDNEMFWRRRVASDHGITWKTRDAPWKEYYRDLRSRWVLMGKDTWEYRVRNTSRHISFDSPIAKMDIGPSWHTTPYLSYMDGLTFDTIAMVGLDGQVLCLGHNEKRMLNSSIGFNVYRPERVEGTNDIDAVDVSCGGSFLYVLDRDGVLWSRGCNDGGRLARKRIWEKDGVGVCVGPNVKVRSIHCGNEYAVAIDVNRDAWAAGNGKYYKLGKRYWNRFRFISLNLSFKVDRVSCGRDHIMYLDVDGNLWGIGRNNLGQLGITICDYISEPTRIIPGVKAISCRDDHSAIIDGGDCLLTCGSSRCGESGTGYKGELGTLLVVVFDNAWKVSCGPMSTLVIDKQGNLWGTGYIYDRKNRVMVERLYMTDMQMMATDVVCGGDGSMFQV